jgi:hypothetical protein
MLASMVAAVPLMALCHSSSSDLGGSRAAAMGLRNEDLEKLKQDLRSKKTTERKVRRRRRGGPAEAWDTALPPPTRLRRDVRALRRGGIR